MVSLDNVNSFPCGLRMSFSFVVDLSLLFVRLSSFDKLVDSGVDCDVTVVCNHVCVFC